MQERQSTGADDEDEERAVRGRAGLTCALLTVQARKLQRQEQQRMEMEHVALEQQFAKLEQQVSKEAMSTTCTHSRPITLALKPLPASGAGAAARPAGVRGAEGRADAEEGGPHR